MLKAVLFDWGNTVMEELYDQAGIMANWKKVAATPGIETALSAIDASAVVCIATNAAESNSDQVRKALERVGLANYFQFIFTASELESIKPQKEYFEKISKRLGIKFEEMVMVGDSLSGDALGPSVLGLHAVWLRRKETPVIHHPFYDAEITSMDQFPDAWLRLQKGELPTVLQSMLLMKKHGMPPKVLKHTQVVALAGYVLARWLFDEGVQVDPILVHRAALLHDIDKSSWKDSGMLHGEAGASYLEQAGFPLLSEPIKRHQIFNILSLERAPQTWESKLVYLADKYAEKDRLVRPEERVEHLCGRYPDSCEMIRSCLEPIHDLEMEICETIHTNPTLLLENIGRAISRVDLNQLHLEKSGY